MPCGHIRHNFWLPSMTSWPTVTINAKSTLQYLILLRRLIQCPITNYYKIQHYGIDGHIHSWIQSFLKGRSQSTVVDGDRCSAAPVPSGVPQGTVLGPLLFLLLINDLPENVQFQVHLFADDCLFYRVIDTAADQHLLQQDLHALEQWGHRWGMRFNASKCEIMRICCSSQPINGISMYQLGGVPLQVVDRAKYLGVNKSNNLSWSSI